MLSSSSKLAVARSSSILYLYAIRTATPLCCSMYTYPDAGKRHTKARNKVSKNTLYTTADTNQPCTLQTCSTCSTLLYVPLHRCECLYQALAPDRRPLHQLPPTLHLSILWLGNSIQRRLSMLLFARISRQVCPSPVARRLSSHYVVRSQFFGVPACQGWAHDPGPRGPCCGGVRGRAPKGRSRHTHTHTHILLTNNKYPSTVSQVPSSAPPK